MNAYREALLWRLTQLIDRRLQWADQVNEQGIRLIDRCIRAAYEDCRVEGMGLNADAILRRLVVRE